MSKAGKVKVEKVWVVGDIGSQIINPSNAENQVQGAVLDGIARRSARRSPSTTAARSRPTSTIPVAPLRQAAPVDVHFLMTDTPTGLGEPALPPVVPALSNAIFAATGKRVRSLPLSKLDLSWS